MLFQNKFRTYFTAILFVLFMEVSVSTEFQAFFSKLFFLRKIVVEEPGFKNVKNKHLGMSPF